MLNPESVDYLEKDQREVALSFTDEDGFESIIIKLNTNDARRLARMILDRTKS